MPRMHLASATCTGSILHWCWPQALHCLCPALACVPSMLQQSQSFKALRSAHDVSHQARCSSCQCQQLLHCPAYLPRLRLQAGPESPAVQCLGAAQRHQYQQHRQQLPPSPCRQPPRACLHQQSVRFKPLSHIAIAASTTAEDSSMLDS
jgi:hypothetical protein